MELAKTMVRSCDSNSQNSCGSNKTLYMHTWMQMTLSTTNLSLHTVTLSIQICLWQICIDTYLTLFVIVARERGKKKKATTTTKHTTQYVKVLPLSYVPQSKSCPCVSVSHKQYMYHLCQRIMCWPWFSIWINNWNACTHLAPQWLNLQGWASEWPETKATEKHKGNGNEAEWWHGREWLPVKELAQRRRVGWGAQMINHNSPGGVCDYVPVRREVIQFFHYSVRITRPGSQHYFPLPGSPFQCSNTLELSQQTNNQTNNKTFTQSNKPTNWSNTHPTEEEATLVVALAQLPVAPPPPPLHRH